jgi:HlyD family secretion protein
VASVTHRGWPIVLVVVLGAILVVAVFSALKKDPDPVARYTVSRVSRGDIVQAVHTIGQLGPWSSVEVSSQISGLVTEVTVDFNSKVTKGQVLARIDPSSYEQKLRQARADLEAAQANHRLTDLRAKRLRGLRDQDLVTQQEYDDAEALLQQSDATLLTGKAEVENARVDFERCTITSPIDGIVIFKQVEVGKTVVASFSAPTLFVIAQDLSKMRVIAPINEVDVGSVVVGQAATFTVDAIPDHAFEGRLTQLRSPYTPSDKQQQQQAGQQSAIPSFDAVIEVDNGDLLLRPSLTANVSIIVDRRRDVLVIPNSALRVTLPDTVGPGVSSRAAGKPFRNAEAAATVYRLRNGDRNGAPETVTVRLGMSDRVSTEVLSGLEPGDDVITGVPAILDFGPKRPF